MVAQLVVLMGCDGEEQRMQRGHNSGMAFENCAEIVFGSIDNIEHIKFVHEQRKWPGHGAG